MFPVFRSVFLSPQYKKLLWNCVKSKIYKLDKFIGPIPVRRRWVDMSPALWVGLYQGPKKAGANKRSHTRRLLRHSLCLPYRVQIQSRSKFSLGNKFLGARTCKWQQFTVRCKSKKRKIFNFNAISRSLVQLVKHKSKANLVQSK